ncbi:MAG: hypothetical protein U5K51_06090 [Flavobacteriaceae bacterium]|nr:hypothetical protein [Flavobacteriaceae bacterium]
MVVAAIRDAEKETSGEIRVQISENTHIASPALRGLRMCFTSWVWSIPKTTAFYFMWMSKTNSLLLLEICKLIEKLRKHFGSAER